MTRSVGNGKNKSRVRRPSIPRPVQQEGDSEEVVIKVDDSEQGSVQQDEDVDGLAAPAEAQVQGSPQRPEKVRTPSNAKTAPYLKTKSNKRKRDNFNDKTAKQSPARTDQTDKDVSVTIHFRTSRSGRPIQDLEFKANDTPTYVKHNVGKGYETHPIANMWYEWTSLSKKERRTVWKNQFKLYQEMKKDE